MELEEKIAFLKSMGYGGSVLGSVLPGKEPVPRVKEPENKSPGRPRSKTFNITNKPAPRPELEGSVKDLKDLCRIFAVKKDGPPEE